MICTGCHKPNDDDRYRLCPRCRAISRRSHAKTRKPATHQVYEPTYPKGIYCALNCEWMR